MHLDAGFRFTITLFRIYQLKREETLHLPNDFILHGDTVKGASDIHPLIALTLRQAYYSITADSGSRNVRILRYPSMQAVLAVLRPYL